MKTIIIVLAIIIVLILTTLYAAIKISGMISDNENN